MRNILLITSLCAALFVSCGHKPTAQELAAARADSIAHAIANIKEGSPVADLLTLPDVEWAIITAQGVVFPDTLILIAAVGDKVCVTDVCEVNGAWTNVRNGFVDKSSTGHIMINKADIASNAIVCNVQTSTLSDMVKTYATRTETYRQQIEKFLVDFYSLVSETREYPSHKYDEQYTSYMEDKYKKILSKQSLNKMVKDKFFDFNPEGVIYKNIICEIVPSSIKISNINPKHGTVTFNMDEYITHVMDDMDDPPTKFNCKFLVQLVREEGQIRIDDIVADGWSLSKGMEDFSDMMSN